MVKKVKHNISLALLFILCILLSGCRLTQNNNFINQENSPQYAYLAPTPPMGWNSWNFFAKDIAMPVTKRGDLVSVFTTGAYGFTMSSNYNARGRAEQAFAFVVGLHIVDPEAQVETHRPIPDPPVTRRTELGAEVVGVVTGQFRQTLINIRGAGLQFR